MSREQVGTAAPAVGCGAREGAAAAAELVRSAPVVTAGQAGPAGFSARAATAGTVALAVVEVTAARAVPEGYWVG